MNSVFPEITKHYGVVESLDTGSSCGVVNCVDFPDKKILIPFSLPGEKILFDKLKYRKSTYYVFSDVVESHSENRVDALCPHFTVCGGCLLQHMNENFYMQYKIKKLKKILSNYENRIKELTVVPYGLRRKANFEAIKKQDKVFLGFHRFNSRQIINIGICKILRKEIVNLIDPLKDLLMQILNEFEKAEFFIVLTENGLDVGLEIQKVKLMSEEKRKIVYEFADKNNIERFTFRHGRKLDEIFCREKKPYLRFADKYEVSINPWSFMQTSKEAEKLMIDEMQKIIDMLDENEKFSCIDLFSGRGTYTLSLLHNFKKVKAVEVSEESINALNEASDFYGLNIETEVRDLFISPVNKDELDKFDLVIINPPRAGAESQSIELSKSNVRNIIYVSCNSETFARDLEILEKRYELISIKPIDQFIWSGHLEIIAHLKIAY